MNELEQAKHDLYTVASREHETMEVLEQAYKTGNASFLKYVVAGIIADYKQAFDD